jgi:hypothetical protein
MCAEYKWSSCTRSKLADPLCHRGCTEAAPVHCRLEYLLNRLQPTLAFALFAWGTCASACRSAPEQAALSILYSTSVPVHTHAVRSKIGVPAPAPSGMICGSPNLQTACLARSVDIPACLLISWRQAVHCSMVVCERTLRLLRAGNHLLLLGRLLPPSAASQSGPEFDFEINELRLLMVLLLLPPHASRRAITLHRSSGGLVRNWSD